MALRYRTRLSIAIGLLIAVAISATSLLILLSTMLGLAENYHSFGVILTRVATREVASGLEVERQVLDLVDQQLTVSALLAAELENAAQPSAEHESAGLQDRFQRVVERSESAVGEKVVDRFAVVDNQGRVQMSTPGPGDAAGKSSSEQYKTVEVPTVDGDGKIQLGIDERRLDSIRNIMRIQNILDRFVQDTNVERAVVVDAGGRVIAARDRDGQSGARVYDRDLIDFCTGFIEDMPGELYSIRDFNGDVGVVTGLADAAGQNAGALFIQHDTAGAAQLARVIMIQIGIVGVIITLIAIWISNYLSKDFSKPIDVLAKGAREFGRGNLDYRVETPSQDEFGSLADAFNSMAGSLREHMTRLEEETRFRERLQSELSIASELQRSLLPVAPPSDPNIQVAGWSVAAKEVGGDFFDYMELGQGRTGIAIGDATGKGLPAALLVTECWSTLKALAYDTHSLSDLLYRTNNALCKRLGRSGRFVTLFCMVVDSDRGVLRYAAAGHNPPILVGADHKRTQLLKCRTGLPLGILPNCRYGEYEIRLEPGDTILLYSDGLTDATAPDRMMYGSDRMEAVLTSLRQRPIEEVVAGLRLDVETHMQGGDMFDDMTVLGVRFTAINKAVA